jgi:hypothetical protein
MTHDVFGFAAEDIGRSTRPDTERGGSPLVAGTIGGR